MLDHLVHKFAVVEVRQQNTVVRPNEVIFLSELLLLHDVAVRLGEQIFLEIFCLSGVGEAEVEILELVAGQPFALLELQATGDELLYFGICDLLAQHQLLVSQFLHQLDLRVALPRGPAVEQLVEDDA